MLCGTGLAAGNTASANPTTAVVGRPDSSQSVSFTVTLPLRNRAALDTLTAQQQNEASPNFHKWLTPATFGLRFGPTAQSVGRVANALQARGFTITATHTRSLSVSGPSSLIEQTFATTLATVRGRSGASHVAAISTIHPFAELTAEGAGIVGLEPIERHINARLTGRLGTAGVDNRYGPDGTYWYDDLKQAYVYPSALASVTSAGGTAAPFTGVGATIGTVISSNVLDSDIRAVFKHEHYSTTTGQADPTLYARRVVNGGAPFSANSDDSFEASLDVQEEIGGAPGAHVVLYNIPNLSDQNIIDAYTDVVDDNVLDVVSSSFGECESYYLPSYNGGMDYTATLLYEHEIYLEGNAQGQTFLASSGDSAGKECISLDYFNGKNGRYIAGASTPATDPNVTAVGGTNVVTVYDVTTLSSGYAGENAWLDQEADEDPYGLGGTVTGHVWGAGGGASVVFAAPSYQSLVTTGSTMRDTPDIGMQVGGCPEGATDYNATDNVCNGGNKIYNGYGNTDRSAVAISFGGEFVGVIGTSVSSPEFAGVLALLVEKNGRMGNVNPYIYSLAARQAKGGRRSYHTEIPGYNGVVQSNVSSTYSVSVGVGTPIVASFLGMPTVAKAGTPQSLSNP